MKILRAEVADLDGVMDLHKRYHIGSICPEDKPDGFVTTNFTEEQLRVLIEEERGVTIAKDGDRVTAYALAASWQFWSQWPLFAYMIERLPENIYHGRTLSTSNSYQYGPICVDGAYRGSGVFEGVFSASLNSMAERYPIMVTFINQVDRRSYAAHTRKAGMDTVCTFQFNSNDYYMLACLTKRS